MGFTEENKDERIRFVNLWSKYVLEHSDRVWSAQQNIIINSCIRNAKISKEDYLKMKSRNRIF
ncbi:MAG: hypothetical protein DRO99_05300 [Candidatus Aenigmatarchaeota archaeon]|nr:MAG: hypothetical protein DRO99_05300 [Candidatus Aenigmarchaeota archaeon]